MTDSIEAAIKQSAKIRHGRKAVKLFGAALFQGFLAKKRRLDLVFFASVPIHGKGKTITLIRLKVKSLLALSNFSHGE